MASQQDTGPLADGGLRVEESPHSLREHILDAILVEGGALQVAHGLDLAGEAGTLLVSDGRLVLLFQFPLSASIAPKVALGANQEDGNTGTMMRHLMMMMMKVRTAKNC